MLGVSIGVSIDPIHIPIVRHHAAAIARVDESNGYNTRVTAVGTKQIKAIYHQDLQMGLHYDNKHKIIGTCTGTRIIEVLNLNPPVLLSIVLLLYRTNIKVLKDALAC